MRFELMATALLVLSVPAAAQRGAQAAAPRGAGPYEGVAPGDTVRTDSALRALRWRLVGPFRGGRVSAVAGDPVHPLVFYFGAVDGGVWKTSNGGQSWHNVSDRARIGAVGALAVAPSDPNVVWVGGGESNAREDVIGGEGVWRSTDAGATWRHLGLEATRHISVIRVDPRDPDRAYVAALGHVFGPNAERGVYRTTDGGRRWEKVLFVNDSTGAVDLALDPANPRILYAAMWKFQRFPWGFSAGGGRSGLWKSTDGGDSWQDISGARGLPPGALGRIGLALAGGNSQRLYASVEAADSTGGIFRSEDGGHSWQRTNADQTFMVRPWYFSGVYADPRDENTVFVLNLGTWKSIDAGRTFARVRVPHGDCHILWIDPANPLRMIEGNDGGATVSYDGGRTWSTLMNQPTAQLYHVVTDDQVPYRIYGAQQDNTTVSIASRSDQGTITERDWYAVGGGESGYIAPTPGDPGTVFAGSYMGTLTRWDLRTRRDFDVSVGLNNYDGYAARDVPFRFQWTFPIVFGRDGKTLYTTSQFVHRSTDEGQSWETISPDLTLHDSTTLGPVGGPITLDMTGTEWYATIFAFAESPVQAGVLWAGSDDGLVHLSRDGGRTWTDVTPRGGGDRGLPRFSRVSILEPSHFDAGTLYLAANRYQQDDVRPYLLRTTDFGRTWTPIVRDIPDGAFTRTIREDPVRRGLLFAGTERGVFASLDDGASWRPLQLNLPRVSVRDLAIHGADLIAATHGRGFWVLDDMQPLRELSDSLRREPVHLFTPEPARRWASPGRGRGGEAAGENPPEGAIVDFYLASRPTGPVTLEFLDGSGKMLRRYTSAMARRDSSMAVRDSLRALPDTAVSGVQAQGPAGQRAATTPARTDSTGVPNARPRIEEDSLAFIPADSVVPARVGLNRFAWSLRTAPAREVKGEVVDEGTLEGARVTPGSYTVRLTVNGRSYTRPFTVQPDPRSRASTADLAAQSALAGRIHDAIDSVASAVARIDALASQARGWRERTAAQPYSGRIAMAASTLADSLSAVRATLSCAHCHADESTLAYPIQLYNKLLSLNSMVLSGDSRPTRQQEQVFADLNAQLARELQRLRGVEATQLAAFNRLLTELSVPGLFAPAPK